VRLEQVVTIVHDVLEGDVVGAYLFGSAVLGGVRPRSDLDVLAVSRRRTTQEDRERLATGLLAVSGGDPPEPARPVELTIVAQPDVTPWRYPPRRDFQYGEWLRDEIERGKCLKATVP
jgi:predicted nucleotidyltransferase